MEFGDADKHPLVWEAASQERSILLQVAVVLTLRDPVLDSGGTGEATLKTHHKLGDLNNFNNNSYFRI